LEKKKHLFGKISSSAASEQLLKGNPERQLSLSAYQTFKLKSSIKNRYKRQHNGT